MSKITTKIKAVSGFLFLLVFTVIKYLPLNQEFNYLSSILDGLAIVTGALYLTAVFKNKPILTNITWVWSAFFLPICCIEILSMFFLSQYVPFEILRIWGLPVSYVVLPFLVSGATLYLFLIMKHLEW